MQFINDLQNKKHDYRVKCINIFNKQLDILLKTGDSEFSHCYRLLEKFKIFISCWVYILCNHSRYSVEESISIFFEFENFKKIYEPSDPTNQPTDPTDPTDPTELTNLIRLFLEYVNIEKSSEKMQEMNEISSKVKFFIKFKKFIPKSIPKFMKKDIEKSIELDTQLAEFSNFMSFEKLCIKGNTKEDIFELVDLYENLYDSYLFKIKKLYNCYIGWALPSSHVCKIIYKTWCEHIKIYKDARIIDVGAGSGIFSLMFHKMGIPRDKIIAIDIETQTHTNPKQRKFWDITTEDFKINSSDIIFVGWGSGTSEIVDNYSIYGSCIILLGEIEGCTFPSDYFENADYFENTDYFETDSYQVPGPASKKSERLTVNRRIINNIIITL